MAKKIYCKSTHRICENSSYLLNTIKCFLKLNKYEIVTSIDICDWIIINTCGLTSYEIISAQSLIDPIIMKYQNHKKIIIFGCLPKVTDKYNSVKGVVCIDSKQIYKFNAIFKHKISIEKITPDKINNFRFVEYQTKLTSLDYYIQICQGCINDCSYCNVKKIKGNVSSKEIKQIIDDVKDAVTMGHKEVTFIGDDCGSFGHDMGYDFAALLEKIYKACPNIRIKIGSFQPRLLIKQYGKLKKFFKYDKISYLNLPIQSASNRILKLMNRGHTMEQLIPIIKDIRNISPKTWLYSHILFCFPTEKRKEFLSSLFASRLFDEAAFLIYSENKNTVAEKIKPKVSINERNKRIEIVNKLLFNNKLKGLLVDRF